MSKESKELLEKVQRTFEKQADGAKELAKEAGKLGDKELTTKIQKVEKSAQEVAEHIKKRSSEG